METTYQKLAAMNVNDHVERKGKFSYLSWSWAVDSLRKASPTATWEVIRFNGLPYLSTEVGYFVEVAVTVDSITLSQIHPVLDNNNKPIQAPNCFQINTSIQRCLVKAIALHGLGLYIYSGEDLPQDEKEATKETVTEECSADLFATIETKFKAAIQSGEKTANSLIKWVSAKTILTNDQKMEIASWEKHQQKEAA